MRIRSQMLYANFYILVRSQAKVKGHLRSPKGKFTDDIIPLTSLRVPYKENRKYYTCNVIKSYFGYYHGRETVCMGY